jgi:hypothetical protein
MDQHDQLATENGSRGDTVGAGSHRCERHDAFLTGGTGSKTSIETSYDGPERRRMTRSPIADTQWHMAPFALLAPDEIPTREATSANLPSHVLEICRADLGTPGSDFAASIAAFAALIPEQELAEPVDIFTLMQAGKSSTTETHDQYCKIVRYTQATPAAYLHAVCNSIGVLMADLAEAPSSIETSRLEHIAASLRASIAFALNEPMPPSVMELRKAPVAVHADYHARRWIRGHQVFTTICQCLIFGFDSLEEAANVGSAEGMNSAAELISDLLLASAHALEYTGDFSAEIYDTVIRVSMCQPFQPAGFSGLLSIDHKHLVKRMKAMKPTMQVLSDWSPTLYQNIQTSLSAVYASHKFVCSRFVGSDKPSLLMAGQEESNAIEQLDRFEKMRLRSLEVRCRGADH